MGDLYFVSEMNRGGGGRARKGGGNKVSEEDLIWESSI